jgi:hypothetical protein
MESPPSGSQGSGIRARADARRPRWIGCLRWRACAPVRPGLCEGLRRSRGCARPLHPARPRPKTHSELGGSGFLCPENDDATAERFATLLDNAGIAVGETLAWNSYPWYINRSPRAAELEAGVEPLRRLLGLLVRLRVVMLHGGSARDGWKRLARRHPDLVHQIEVVPTYHTSSQAFIGPPEVRAARMTGLAEAFAQTARILQEPGRTHPAG